jgi:molybdopterin molybdotransferase
MPEFLNLVTPEEALKKLFETLEIKLLPEQIQTVQGLGRVTAEDLRSGQDLPDFRRSTVDGYAVRAKDTYGASESLPSYLTLVGEITMGSAPQNPLEENSCALIHTGGMLPEGADGVVMLENTQTLDTGVIEILRPAAVNENVIEVGEDVSSGEVVIPRGTRLRPAEIGGLMALGITSLTAVRKPVIGIISSGDEVVPPERDTQPGQVRDVNSYTLGSLISDYGGDPVHYGIISDSREDLLAAMSTALEECDHLIVTAGSSASSRDLTAEIMNGLGDPGVLVHGLSVRPGKPTIIAVRGGQVMIGLPGNPVSALVIGITVVGPIMERLLGLTNPRPQPALLAKLTVNLSSQAGREDWIPVRVIRADSGELLAEPVFGRSNLIFVLSRADGLVKIPASATGLEAGTMVTVRLI